MRAPWPVFYSIAECTFPASRHDDRLRDTAFLGVFKLSKSYEYPSYMSREEVDMQLGQELKVRANLTGGAGPPSPCQAAEVFERELGDLISAFLDRIPQKTLVLFEDGDGDSQFNLGREMVSLIAKRARSTGKNIICVVTQAFRDTSRPYNRKIYAQYCLDTERLADRTVYIDVTMETLKTKTLAEYDLMRHLRQISHLRLLWQEGIRGSKRDHEETQISHLRLLRQELSGQDDQGLGDDTA